MRPVSVTPKPCPCTPTGAPKALHLLSMVPDSGVLGCHLLDYIHHIGR